MMFTDEEHWCPKRPGKQEHCRHGIPFGEVQTAPYPALMRCCWCDALWPKPRTEPTEHGPYAKPT